MATEEKKVLEEGKEVTEKIYIAAVGRRKESIAQVRIYLGKGFIVNEKELGEFFLDANLPKVAQTPLTLLGDEYAKFKVTVKVLGGGKRGQAEAIRLGLARALQAYEPELRPILKGAGLLKRDPRMKERKKPGLRKARRAPQWSKR